MEHIEVEPNQDQRLALLSLWTIPGVGPRALETLAEGPGWVALLDRPPLEWTHRLTLADTVLHRLARVKRLSEIGERTLERAHAAGIQIAFADEPAYPELLRGLPDMPPLLFYRGTPGPTRRRVALVGSRHPDNGFLPKAQRFAREVAEAGVGVVSGAADGVDQSCHQGALDAGGETWAFLGAGLDELDPSQASLSRRVLEGGGVFYSELPPGVRANKQTFPRRNRLVSGASDAVVILRAAFKSGCRHTALAAMRQKRPLFVMPGEADNAAAWLCNHYLRKEWAHACVRPKDVLGTWGYEGPRPSITVRAAGDLSAVSSDAQAAYRLLPRERMDFDEVLQAAGIPAARLTSALCELELAGLVVQHPGKQYERM